MAYSVPPSSEPSIALFSSSTAKVLLTGGTSLGYDTNATYNSPIVLNTFNAPSNISTFTIGASGLYSVEASTSVAANGATWSPTVPRAINLRLTRGGVTVTAASMTVPYTSATDYSLHTSCVFPFKVGDTIQIQHTGAISTGSPTALGLQNTFDLNTWVTFQYIKSV